MVADESTRCHCGCNGDLSKCVYALGYTRTLKLSHDDAMLLIGAVNHMADSVKEEALKIRLALLAGKLMSDTASRVEE